jgi:carboxyl-terminal processing protease
MVRQNANRIKKDADRTNFNLNLDTYLKELKAQSQEAKKYETLMKTPTSLKVAALETDIALNKSDTARSEITQRMIEDLSKDIYLEEGFMVIKDMIRK